jgi:hypothetical protein
MTGCVGVDGMRIGRGNRSTRKETAPVPHWPPEILYDLTREWTWIAVLGRRRLTACCSCASLSITSWRCVKNGGTAPSILTLNGSEWSVSRPGRKEISVPAGRSVGPIVDLDTVKKRNVSCPCWKSNPDSWVIHPVACHYTDWAILAVP